MDHRSPGLRYRISVGRGEKRKPFSRSSVHSDLAEPRLEATSSIFYNATTTFFLFIFITNHLLSLYNVSLPTPGVWQSRYDLETLMLFNKSKGQDLLTRACKLHGRGKMDTVVGLHLWMKLILNQLWCVEFIGFNSSHHFELGHVTYFEIATWFHLPSSAPWEQLSFPRTYYSIS